MYTERPRVDARVPWSSSFSTQEFKAMLAWLTSLSLLTSELSSQGGPWIGCITLHVFLGVVKGTHCWEAVHLLPLSGERHAGLGTALPDATANADIVLALAQLSHTAKDYAAENQSVHDDIQYHDHNNNNHHYSNKDDVGGDDITHDMYLSCCCCCCCG